MIRRCLSPPSAAAATKSKLYNRTSSSLLANTKPSFLICNRPNQEDNDDNATKRFISSRSLSFHQSPYHLALAQQQQQHRNGQITRGFHATSKQEILPLIAVIIGGVTIRYSYKAWVRMNDEWEEYEEKLREYKLEHGLDPDAPLDIEVNVQQSGERNSNAGMGDAVATFKGGTMAIDLGTVNIRIAHSFSTDKKPNVVVDRQGGRSTPNYILMPEGEDVVLGRLAHGKEHQNQNVLKPRLLLSSPDENNDEKEKINKAVRHVIYDAAKNALEQTLGATRGGAFSGTAASKPLFSIDANSQPNTFEAQPIYTYPPPSASSTETSLYLQHYQSAVSSLSSPSHISNFISEPIAALRGAKLYNLLPSLKGQDDEYVIVMDVGGKSTSISLVQPKTEEIKYSTTISHISGQTLIDACVTNLIKSFYSLSSPSELNDTMALQRLYDASSSAIMELSTKTRAEIDIPYLTVDEQMKPKHLKMGLSRKVVEAEMNTLISKEMLQSITQPAEELSMSFPTPTNLPSLVTSLFMKLFETTNVNPFSVNGILVVGGGARSPIVIDGITKGVSALVGDQFVHEKLVVPEGELVEELVVLGAAASSDL